MAIMTRPQEMSWPHTYWVQPGEVAVLIDGGSTSDPNGTPNVFRQGDQVRARFRMFARGRQQQMVLFDAKRQGRPIALADEQFRVREGMNVTLSADIYYRVSNPLPLLETVHLDNPEEIEAAITGRVRHLIERLIQRRPFAFFLGMHDTIRDLLLNNLWLAENDLILEDVVVYRLEPPPQIEQAQATLIARLAPYRERVATLLDGGINPTFTYIQEHDPALAQHVLARTAEQYQQFVPRPGSTEASHDLALVARDAWDSVISTAQSDMDDAQAAATSSGWARQRIEESPLAPQMESPAETGPAVPSIPPDGPTAPLLATVESPSGPEETTSASTAQVDPEQVSAEVSRIAGAGYFVRRTGADALSVQLPDRTVTFRLPVGFPESPPTMTVVGPAGTSADEEPPWAPNLHLVDLLAAMTESDR